MGGSGDLREPYPPPSRPDVSRAPREVAPPPGPSDPESPRGISESPRGITDGVAGPPGRRRWPFLPDVPLKNIIWASELPLLVLNAAALLTAVAAWYRPGAAAMTLMSLGVCLLVAGLGLRRTLRASPAAGPLPGNYVLARLTLVYAVFGVHVPRSGEGRQIIPAALIAACLLAEPVAKAFAAQAFPYAANFPGVRSRASHIPTDAVFWINLAATAVTTALGHHLLPIEVVVASVAVLVNVASLLDMALFAVQRLVFNARLPQLWETMRPAFAVHWQAAPGSIHQLAMWMDYLAALGRPFFVITRTRDNFLEVTERFDVPVLHRVGLDAVEDALSPTLKTVFYVNTAILNDHMLRYPHLNHIQLNHGDSDKVASYSPVFRAYDKDFVAGQAAIDRFAAAGLATAPGFFAIVGRPQVAGVEPARGPVGAMDRPTALYAPTWTGNTQDSNYTSLPKAPLIVQALLDRGCTVVFRPHPYWDKNHRTAAGRQAVVEMLAKDAAATGRPHVYGAEAESELSVFDCFNLSDFMVSDVSSVVNDYLFSLKPLVMMAVTTTAAEAVEEFPVARGAYVVEYAGLGEPGAAAHTLDQALDAIW
ncbi:MAG: CDP-glycerol glycerophosphotransferase family protein, partial [Bifidobacteriaceae bacterium]|nr:CDP-glycerol glycerophosphotransferase family protein [Bifidobacteriaceae bacterium]